MNIRQVLIACILGISSFNYVMAQKERSEIDDKYKWNVYDLYSSDDEWEAKLAEVIEKSKHITDFKGRIGRSAKDLLDYFDFTGEINKEFTRLSIYSSLKADEDLGNQDNIARDKKIEMAYVDYEQLSSFDAPELAAIPQDKIIDYTLQQPRLQEYALRLDRLRRNKVHILSDAEEALMAKTGLLGNVPYSTYGIFSNAEMPNPTITLSDGTSVELTKSAYSVVRASAVREDREAAFNAFWDNYKKYEGTYGELMNGNIRQNIFETKARNYSSALEAALYGNNIPTEVYHSLIENVNKNLPTFHRYLRLKQRLMNLDTLKYSDLYAPTVKNVELKYTYEEAQQLVLEAIKPLGKNYSAVVRNAFDSRWIDVFPNKGKASGAYSNGAAYDVHPYILMNYDGLYESVGTLIHELGHTMHSYFSNKNQPYATSRYVTFVAEVASTFNEALLDNMMLGKLTDKGEKISLLMSMLDGFKGTLFRQTQFAEFELAMHEMAERGEPLTGKVLSKLYGDIVRKYYGHADGVCYVDPRVDIEWAFVPHFYMGFYVYQYSTSFVASQALSEIVMNGKQKDVDRYLAFLSAGGSKYPIDILKDAGVDMTTSEPFDKAIEKMNKIMDEVEKLIDK